MLMTLSILSQQYLKRSSLFWVKRVGILPYDNLLVRKGNAVYLLQSSAKLKSERKPAKQYQINFDDQEDIDEEEKKEENDMN